MPTLAIIDGVVVRMFYFDHDPAHFHAVFGGQEMRVAIGSLQVIDGSLPPSKRRKIMAWAARRQAELALCWVRCRAGEKPGEDRAVMRRIVSATPMPKHRLAIQWASGESAEVDLAPLFRSGVFATVRSARSFATVELGDRGRYVFWRDAEGDELDLCADALWNMAFHHADAAAE